MSIKTGDTVTVKRGQYRNQQGHVQLVINEGSELAIQLSTGEDEGKTVLVKTSNVREPQEATITQDELAAILNSVGDGSTLHGLVHALDAKFPGFASKVSMPVPDTSAE